MRFFLGLLSLWTFTALSQSPIETILEQDELLKTIAENPKYQVQIIYTQIDRDKENKPTFKSFKYKVDGELYFYPASTVKMPAAFLALEKLNQTNIIGLDATSPLTIGANREPQVPMAIDSTSADMKASIAQFVKKIFVVSDNDAYNRLYEFLGQGYFNETLQSKGYTETRILHRLGPEGFPFGVKDNQFTNPFSFYNAQGNLIFHQGEVQSRHRDNLILRNQVRGKAHVNKEDQLVAEPFDFSIKNFFSLQDLHDVLKAVMFPSNTSSYKRFNLKPSDYDFLYEWMSKLPKDSGMPSYESKPDNYVKFFSYGDQKDTQLPSSRKVFNKVGWAYGFLTDVSYIIDTDHEFEYLLAATIHVNENETYNDGEYEYETIGMSFYGRLGRAFDELEKERKRKFKPNFENLGLGL